MKKRTIKQQAKYAEKKILEENKDFYNKIIAENYPKSNNRVKRIVGWSSSAFAAVLTVVLLFVFLWPSGSLPVNPADPGEQVIPGDPIIPDPPDNTKHYLLENETMVLSDLTDLQVYLEKNFLNLSLSNYECVVRCAYDSESNDDLYFFLDLVGDEYFETISIYIFINPDYENKKQIESDQITETNIGGFVVKYQEIISKDQDDIYTFNYTAITEQEEIIIYIEYEQMWFEEETNFFNFFENSIKVL